MSTGYLLLNRDEVSKNYSWDKIKKVLQVVSLWSLLISMAYLFVRVIKNDFNPQALIVIPKTFFGGTNSARVSMAILVPRRVDYYICDIPSFDEI